MANVINWQDNKVLEDGCGGLIYKVIDVENSHVRNVEIAMCIFNPDEMADLHYHDIMEEIYFFIEGEGEIELNGKWHKVKAEDSVAIPVKTKHRIHNTSKDKPLRFLSINSPHWRETDMIRATPD